jgi:hypothetical protein
LSPDYRREAAQSSHFNPATRAKSATFEPFTTRMAFQLYALASRSDYRLRFMPPTTDAPEKVEAA